MWLTILLAAGGDIPRVEEEEHSVAPRSLIGLEVTGLTRNAKAAIVATVVVAVLAGIGIYRSGAGTSPRMASGSSGKKHSIRSGGGSTTSSFGGSSTTTSSTLGGGASTSTTTSVSKASAPPTSTTPTAPPTSTTHPTVGTTSTSPTTLVVTTTTASQSTISGPDRSEVAGGSTNTWTDYIDAGGQPGQSIQGGVPVMVSCRVQGIRGI